jgi:epoxide hydrolase-like predicted phosphatase
MVEIEAIIFDFGGVMVPFIEASSLIEEEARVGLEPGSLAGMLWGSAEWRQAELGAITDEEYWRRIGVRLGMDTDDEIRDFAWELFGDVKANPRLVELVGQLGEKYRTGLLSNATDILPRLLRDHYHFDGLFQVEVISAIVGLAKPDPAIYRLALEGLGTAPEATIFVDDLEPNVEAAEALGLKAIHFQGYSALLKRLREYRIDLR